MNGILKLLTAVLVLQLAVVIGLNLRPDKLQSYSSDQPIVALEPSKLDKLTVADSSKSLSLVKQGDKWSVEDSNAFPADSKKVNELLDKIAGFRRSWPVAQTESSFKALKVADDEFERKLSFKNTDGSVVQLVLGTSPSFKKVHGRVAKDNFVYALDLNVVDLPLVANDWLDREFLFLNVADIEAIDLPQVALVQKDKKFQPSDLADGEEVNQIEMDALIGQLAQLRFTDMLGKEKPANFDQLKEEVSFNLKVQGPTGELSYLARGPVEENFYLLKRSDTDYYFKIPKGVAEKVRSIVRTSLVQTKATDDQSSEQAGAEQKDVDGQANSAAPANP